MSSGKILLDKVDTSKARLTDKYPNAYRDFHGCGTPCVYKSGNAWTVRKGPQAQGILREARPVYNHLIQPVWLSILTCVSEVLDAKAIKWTSIGPRAYANEGEAKPFCPFILRIAVVPESLIYEDAVAAADVIKEILASVDPKIEVAFVESVVTRSAGPKLLSFDPLVDLPALRKPFTPTLSLSLAPLDYPHYEGTGGLYLRLSQNNDRIVVLTCAHVARPSPVYDNTEMTYTKTSQPREEIVILGTKAYDNAINAMLAAIESRGELITAWHAAIERLGEPMEGEDKRVTERRHKLSTLVEMQKKEIEEAEAVHCEATRDYSTLEQRTIGFVLHSEKIDVSVKQGFTNDWAFVELYRDKIDWTTFKGNKVFIGMSFCLPLVFPSLTSFSIYHFLSFADGNFSISDYRDISPMIGRIIVIPLMVSCQSTVSSRMRRYADLNNLTSTVRSACWLSKMD